MPNITDAIDNETELPDPTTEQANEATEHDGSPAEPQPVSLDDALAKAFEKHTPPTGEADKPAKGPLPNTPTVERPEGKQFDPVTGREIEPMKAPAGWTPALRERWGTIDPVVQRFIHDRETQIAQTISKTADERKTAAEFREIVQPYEATLRNFGISGAELTKNLFSQWNALQTGSPVQRAQLIDGFIRHFKPDINTLIQLANGQAVAPQPAPQPSVDELVEQKLVAREQAAQEAALNDGILAFSSDPNNEFFEDVKVQMGRIIAAELVDGKTPEEMMKKAYDLACSQHPEISQILAARKPVVPALPRRQPVASVKPSLGRNAKSPTAPKRMTLDDAIAEAVKRHST